MIGFLFATGIFVSDGAGEFEYLRSVFILQLPLHTHGDQAGELPHGAAAEKEKCNNIEVNFVMSSMCATSFTCRR